MCRQWGWNEGVHVDVAGLVRAQRDSLRGWRRLLEPLRRELHVSEGLRQLPASDRDLRVDDYLLSVRSGARQSDAHELHLSITRRAMVVYAVMGRKERRPPLHVEGEVLRKSLVEAEEGREQPVLHHHQLTLDVGPLIASIVYPQEQ
jgi:hypothetical protein